ncbi:MAG: hypothetical protein HC854_07020 [Flavobacterium sp.]|nr:hypothetical protein [Flavobacterium sp.]
MYLGNNYTGNAPQPFPSGTILPITSTPSTVTFNGYVRANMPLGSNYKWFVKLAPNTANDNGAAFGQQVAVTVQGQLSSSSFSIASDEMYVSHELKSLVVNTNTVASNSAVVYDVMGKKIVAIDNLKEQASFDFSSLGNGVFVLLTNDNRKLKFVL